MSDRVCIQSGGKRKLMLSPEDLLACCDKCHYGCNGGYSANAWEFFIDNGIVTGGDFNSSIVSHTFDCFQGITGFLQGCQPYSLLPFIVNIAPQCQNTCQNSNYNVSYKNDKHYGDGFYLLQQNVEQIQLEIMRQGPVEATFFVFEDFEFYKSGVYFYTSGEFVG